MLDCLVYLVALHKTNVKQLTGAIDVEHESSFIIYPIINDKKLIASYFETWTKTR